VRSRSLVRSAPSALLFAALAAAPALAAGPDLVVNAVADGDDGACTTAAAGCTLREAIAAVNSGTDRAIGFDPVVFPAGTPATIVLASALPPIARSGASVDGTGAGVRINGDSSVIGTGLAFVSPAGVALTGVRVRNLTIDEFSEAGLFVCAGLPDCEAPLSDVLVEHVHSHDNGFGIVVDGSTTSGVAVRGVVTEGNGGTDIMINASGDVAKVSVVGSSAELFGIVVNAGGNLAAATVADNAVFDATGTGIVVNAGEVVTKARIAGNRVIGSADIGIDLTAGAGIVAPRIEGNHSSGNGAEGIRVVSGSGLSLGRIVGNTTTANVGIGLSVGSPERTLVQSNRSDQNLSGVLLSGTGVGSRVKSNVANGNHGFGIRIGTGQDGVRITGNRAIGSATLDLDDENVDCAGNRWSKNLAQTVGSACTLGAP
jgi:CSLREA domain-containing protein